MLDILTRAISNVATAKRCVERERAHIARLEAAGASTEEAKHTLRMFEQSLKLLEEHARMVRASMEFH